MPSLAIFSHQAQAHHTLIAYVMGISRIFKDETHRQTGPFYFFTVYVCNNCLFVAALGEEEKSIFAEHLHHFAVSE